MEVEQYEKIGGGSEGAVFRGSWHGAPVALKVLSGEMLEFSDLDEYTTLR